MADLPTGTVTFRFTDIEGSTTRWEQHWDMMQAAFTRLDSILRTSARGMGKSSSRPSGCLLCRSCRASD